MSKAEPINQEQLLANFNSFLIDAYGVLVRAGEAIPGAISFIEKLQEEGKEFFILSNDASRTPASNFKKYTDLGFSLKSDQILTSGLMIQTYFQMHDLAGAKTLVFGPTDSRQLVKEAGGQLVKPFAEKPLDVVVICDERQDDLIDSLNDLASCIFNSTSPDEIPLILLANPDLIYPSANGRYGMTAGSLACMIRAWLQAKWQEQAPEIVLLGKPSPFIFEQALLKLEDKNPLMIGDQIATDIVGAKTLGLPSCLSLMGIIKQLEIWHQPKPDYVLTSWEVS